MDTDFKKFTEAMDEYEKTFNDSFPNLCVGGTEKDMIEMINRCIKEKKDVYELGYATLDLDVVY